MARAWLSLLAILILAACSSTPPSRFAARVPASGNAAPAYRTTPGFPKFVDHSVGEEEISIQAMSLVGVPYRWGGNTPQAGFDCSGLVAYVVRRAAQVNLPRTTAQMGEVGTVIQPDEISPGDLIFFNTEGRAHSHVGIYVGKMRFVNAPSTGGTVRIDYVSNPYWAKRFDGIRRVASSQVRPTPFDASVLLAAPSPISPSSLAATPNSDDPESIAGNNSTSNRSATRTADLEPAESTAPSAAPDNAASSSARSDAYEPPPSSAAVAEAQAQRILDGGAPNDSPNGPSTTTATSQGDSRAPAVTAAPFSQTADDPIARFATSR